MIQLQVCLELQCFLKRYKEQQVSETFQKECNQKLNGSTVLFARGLVPEGGMCHRGVAGCVLVNGHPPQAGPGQIGRSGTRDSPSITCLATTHHHHQHTNTANTPSSPIHHHKIHHHCHYHQRTLVVCSFAELVELPTSPKLRPAWRKLKTFGVYTSGNVGSHNFWWSESLQLHGIHIFGRRKVVIFLLMFTVASESLQKWK